MEENQVVPEQDESSSGERLGAGWGCGLSLLVLAFIVIPVYGVAWLIRIALKPHNPYNLYVEPSEPSSLLTWGSYLAAIVICAIPIWVMANRQNKGLSTSGIGRKWIKYVLLLLVILTLVFAGNV